MEVSIVLPKDRIAAVFEHKPTDKVPIYQAGLSSRVASAVLGREAYVGGGIQQYREACALWEGEDAHQEYLARSRRDAFDLVRILDLDMVRPSYWRMAEKPSQRIDEYTFLYGDPAGTYTVRRFHPGTELYQVVEQSPRPEPTMEDLERTVEAFEASVLRYTPTSEDFPDLLAAIREFGDHRGIPGTGIAVCIPRERVWLEAIVLRPDLVRRYLLAQAKRAERVVPIMAEMGLRYLAGGGDFASKHGPFYSPKAFHELMLPALKVVSEACHTKGCYHMFASDGDLWPVSEDLFGASGVDCFYEIDRRAGMDLSLLLDRFPHLTLMGGIASETLHLGTKQEVIEETLSALQVAKERGSCIIGCSNQIVAPTPIENFEAMMETLHEYR
ncbi:MAG: uroporphyrinogen decarboxylase family protein [Candidatus Zipacnadales bacterium]